MERKLLRPIADHRQWEAEGCRLGDYWFTNEGKVILSCPYCGNLGECNHQVLSKLPLTLSPSVVEHPCDHHFFVDNGWAG